MDTCYRFEKVTGENPLFRNIDATYILHLENNGRIDPIRKGLSDYFPSTNTHIVFNKGYKTCKKNLPKQASPFDIVDANLTIFRDAQEKNYRNILVLEDDFVFHEKIRDHNHHVDAFIHAKQDDEFLYFLGCLPGVVFPFDLNHYRVLLGVGTHSVIYSRKYREALLITAQHDMDDWDMFQIRFRPLHRYMYRFPLCYQLFPETENSTMWGNGNFLLSLFAKLMIQIFKWMNLHRAAEPGYSIFYFISKAIILAVVVVVVMYIFRKRILFPLIPFF